MNNSHLGSVRGSVLGILKKPKDLRGDESHASKQVDQEISNYQSGKVDIEEVLNEVEASFAQKSHSMETEEVIPSSPGEGTPAKTGPGESQT